jgi:predicted acylesterase/phospholipase RssA
MGSQKIGLCLSGGGHRASIFSLGALLYLVDADRHRDIETISSVSGGSLTSGFLAVQQKPLNKMNSTEFDACAATWACQIAGSPAWWRTAFVGQALLSVAWALFVCMGWGWLTPLASFITLTPAWWEIQVIYLAAVCVWASIVGARPGGTFWGWWGTWVYLGIAFPTLFLLVFVWWSPLSWQWCLLIFTVAACALTLRSRVADLAFRATVCGTTRLPDIHRAPRHIFCTTEMQTGTPAFVSRDFIYVRAAGLGQVADLPLSTAVQFSANFPVAFPYRVLRLKKHEFRLGTARESSSLALSDGGVLDNTGVSWFLGAPERNASLERFLRHGLNSEPVSDWLLLTEPVRQRIESQLASMGKPPDVLVVVNSSSSRGLAPAKFHGIPVFGELLALVRVQAAMYGARGREQSRDLHRRFFEKPLTGAVVTIGEHPDRLRRLIQHRSHNETDTWEDELLQELGLSDLPDTVFELYRQRAEAASKRDEFGPEYATDFERYAERSRERRQHLEELRRGTIEVNQRRKEANWSNQVPTTFRPLGASATSALLRNGYLNCMDMCNLLLDFPRFDDPPTSDELLQLALGNPRQRHPTRGSESATAAS